MLVNERSGNLVARLTDGTLQVVQADFSDLSVRGELGLMGMVVDPEFSVNRRLYTCQGDREVGQVKVVAWRINGDYTRVEGVDDPLVGNIPSRPISITAAVCASVVKVIYDLNRRRRSRKQPPRP